jgi:hypothetical protein
MPVPDPAAPCRVFKKGSREPDGSLLANRSRAANGVNWGALDGRAPYSHADSTIRRSPTTRASPMLSAISASSTLTARPRPPQRVVARELDANWMAILSSLGSFSAALPRIRRHHALTFSSTRRHRSPPVSNAVRRDRSASTRRRRSTVEAERPSVVEAASSSLQSPVWPTQWRPAAARSRAATSRG